MTNTPLSAGKASSSESVASRIVNQITDIIIRGKLKPGDKLPTESELCSAFCVGRNSVREAIKTLEAYGIVHIRRAEGTFINDTYTEKMLNPMLYGLLLEKDFRQDIVQLRKVLDIGILYKILLQPSDCFRADILYAFENLRQVSEMPKVDAHALLDADVRFHLSFVNATQNRLIIDIYSYVDRITLPSRQETMDHILHSGKLPEFLKLHQDILDLVSNQNLSGINAALTEHYQFWEQKM